MDRLADIADSVAVASGPPPAARRRVLSHLVTECGGVRAGERVLVLCDASTRDIAAAAVKEIAIAGADGAVMELSDLGRHGAEPPAAVATRMLDVDLTMSLCRYSLAHSRARLATVESGRFLSLPQYDWDLLDDPALLVDYAAQARTVRRFADAFTAGSEVRVATSAGTAMTMRIDGRMGNYCPGFVRAPGDLGSPPDIEANVSPIEESAQGIAAIDGSITCPELGLLAMPVMLTVADGRIVAIASERRDYVSILDDMLGPIGSARRVLAECGVGLNPRARLTGIMLTDEGALGCVHFGFGANDTVGGRNKVDFHLDFVMRDASLWVDRVAMLQSGELA